MIYLDNQIKVPKLSTMQGVIIPFYRLQGLAAVINDKLLTRDVDWSIDNNGIFTLESSGQAYSTNDLDEVTIGIQYDFEIEPTDLVELGEPGMVKRPEKMALYLRDSGECAVTINDKTNKFGKTLAQALQVSGNLSNMFICFLRCSCCCCAWAFSFFFFAARLSFFF